MSVMVVELVVMKEEEKEERRNVSDSDRKN